MKKKQLLGILLAGTMMVGAAVPVFAADGDRVHMLSGEMKLRQQLHRQLLISSTANRTRSK